LDNNLPGEIILGRDGQGAADVSQAVIAVDTSFCCEHKFSNSSAADQSQQDCDHCDHKKNMDDVAYAEYEGSKKPSYDEDDRNNV